MSLILKPDEKTTRPQLVTAAAAVATVRAIESQTAARCGIKWVNDLILRDRKVCGILTEPLIDAKTGAIDSLIVGVGINCFTPPGGFPPELRDIAGALDFPDISREKLCADIAAGIVSRFSALDSKELREEYLSFFTLTGSQVQFMYNGALTSARVLGIDADYNLRVKFADGSEALLTGGEISVLKEKGNTNDF
jgi:BirA family biotin operon repressor/biotin-[acetyl-CoA-carboxylase] ligase